MGKQVPAGFVVVALDHRYSENNGAFDVTWLWDGVQLQSVQNADFDITPEQWATEEQKQAAGEVYQQEYKPTAVRDMIGCTVTLQRSRKAPNKVPLIVLDYVPEGCCPRYGNMLPEEIKVELPDNAGTAWVSSGCIKDVVKGKLPYWAE